MYYRVPKSQLIGSISMVCVHRLLRMAILSESVMRGDDDSVAKVKEMFSNWSKLNARFASRSTSVYTQAPCGLRGCKNRPTPFPDRR